MSELRTVPNSKTQTHYCLVAMGTDTTVLISLAFGTDAGTLDLDLACFLPAMTHPLHMGTADVTFSDFASLQLTVFLYTVICNLRFRPDFGLHAQQY